MKENLSPAELKGLLTSKHDLIFFPKRKLVIPRITATQLKSVCLRSESEYVNEDLVRIYDFLSGYAVGDQFGSDHTKRRQWTYSMYKLYGKEFLNLYYDNNQFRVNKLSMVRLNIVGFTDYVINQEWAKQINSWGKHLSDLISGKLSGSTHYNQIVSLDQKLVIVHSYEDTAINLLNLLNSSSQTPNAIR